MLRGHSRDHAVLVTNLGASGYKTYDQDLELHLPDHGCIYLQRIPSGFLRLFGVGGGGHAHARVPVHPGKCQQSSKRLSCQNGSSGAKTPVEALAWFWPPEPGTPKALHLRTLS